MRRVALTLSPVLLLGMYLSLWPVPIDPQVWTPPEDPTGTAPYGDNQRLDPVEDVSVGGCSGPEDVAVDSHGRIYTGCEDGNIVRLAADGTRPEVWVNTKGRPLGMEMDGNDTLFVADAYQGLVSVDVAGMVQVVASEADGKPILYADDVDVASDGKVYLSDATSRFDPRDTDVVVASLLEVMEHGNTGRLLVYDPATQEATTLVGGLSFANGVSVAHDESFVLVNDTGNYRVVRYWLTGPRKGQQENLMEALPGFPDNVTRGTGGRFWITLAAPRSPELDQLAGSPFMRKLVQRLPEFMKSPPAHTGHLIAIDRHGTVLQDLQRPHLAHDYTSAHQVVDYLYLGTATGPSLQRWSMQNVPALAEPDADVKDEDAGMPAHKDRAK